MIDTPQTSELDPARIVRVVDVETSGLPEDEHHDIVEMGWVDIDLASMKIGNPVTFFVNPGHPIPPHIRAVHHISDRDVADAMKPEQAIALLHKGPGQQDVLAAHRATFEQAFIQAERRWVCTYKCALRAWQEEKSHSNQALRYSLDLDAEPDFDPTAAMPPHRALPDAYVTARIMRKLLGLRPLSRLVEISSEPALSVNVNFGKHKGSKWIDLPRDYLEWIIEKSDLDQETKDQARYWLGRRG